MPILVSQGAEIRRWLLDLGNPRRRTAAALRLRALGSRVVTHVNDELGRLDGGVREAVLEVLSHVDTAEARAVRKRLNRAGGEPASSSAIAAPSRASPWGIPGTEDAADTESVALSTLRRLPPTGRKESAAVHRDRSEAHLALARLGSRLARKDLLQSLTTVDPGRSRVYCEAAGLIGDGEFLGPLARLTSASTEAFAAIAAIARREKITPRSRLLRTLNGPLATLWRRRSARNEVNRPGQSKRSSPATRIECTRALRRGLGENSEPWPWTRP